MPDAGQRSVGTVDRTEGRNTMLTRTLSAIFLCLLLRCTHKNEPADDDTTADDDATAGDDDTTAADDDSDDDDVVYEDPCDGAPAGDPCCAEPFDSVYICVFSAYQDVVTTGHFLQWRDGDSEFRTTDGESIEFWVAGTDAAFEALPDLSQYDELSFVQRGGCDGKDGFYDAVYFFTGEYPGELVLMWGDIDVEDLGGWTVSGPKDVTTCPARPRDRCWEFEHNHPVTVSNQQESWELYQGEEVDTGSYTIRMLAAWSGSGSKYCTCGTPDHLSNWWIQPATEQPR